MQGLSTARIQDPLVSIQGDLACTRPSALVELLLYYWPALYEILRCTSQVQSLLANHTVHNQGPSDYKTLNFTEAAAIMVF